MRARETEPFQRMKEPSMPNQPKVLLIGDSISIGYEPYVSRALTGEFRVVHNESNGGDTTNVLANLEAYLLADGDAEIVHFNAGLHDIKRRRDEPGLQVPLEAYRRDLTEIVRRLKQTASRLIWATTTPVIYERHHANKSFDRRPEDVSAYNAAAREIMDQAGIPVADLNAVVVAAGTEKLVCDDGVHMTDEGYRLLGDAVVEGIHKHGRV